MWGCISTEASYQLNFNSSFSTTRSDVLVHLAQWQYWWWFWFAFLWSFYYFVISRIVRFRSLKMRPKIVTSYRPHGKWGDFLAAIVPGLWCLNILTNSNFILRLIEWQNESSLFVVRVRARQWYWVYKFELKNFTDILSAPKNLGRNKWQLNTFGDLKVADDYLHVLQYRAQNRWVKSYWDTVFNRFGKVKSNHSVSNVEAFRSDLFLLNFSNNDLNSLVLKSSNELSANNHFFSNFSSFFISKKSAWSSESLPSSSLFSVDSLVSSLFLSSDFSSNSKNFFNSRLNFFYKFFSLSDSHYSSKNSFMYSDFVESSRYLKKQQGVLLPFRLIKFDLNNPSLEPTTFFRLRWNNGESNLQSKPTQNTPYLSIKQKRYERKKVISPITKYFLDSDGNKTKKVRYSGKSILLNNTIFDDYVNDATSYYRMVKKNKKRGELIPVTLSKRILRTKKTLVLPAHTNITLVTNSFDIVHSWFIPGLGIKLDCVPGRSTHHTLYNDCVGFYYGQCAEICGRYHHHMPIRVCALPFEHFLVWWHSYGITKLIFTNNQKRYSTYYSFRKYIW